MRRRAARPTNWRSSPIPYANYYRNRALLRLNGTADVRDTTVPWSVVVKILRPPPGLPPATSTSTTAPAAYGTQPSTWDREARTYRSGLLSHLPGGLTAPRLLHIDRSSSEQDIWLWLEYVHDSFDGHWPLSQYAIAARHLGRFNGAYLTTRPLPTHRWLNRHWAESHSEPHRLPIARHEIAALLTRPDVRAAIAKPLAIRILQLLDDQPRFIDALSRLPQTLCHHDASSANLFARRRDAGRSDDDPDTWDTVAIDWEEIGPGPVGAEIATLVFGSMRLGDFPATHANELAHSALEAYERGLRDAGWRGDSATVRCGFNAAVALRWWVTLGALRLLVDPVARGGLPNPEEGLLHRLTLMRFLLDCADNARGHRC